MLNNMVFELDFDNIISVPAPSTLYFTNKGGFLEVTGHNALGRSSVAARGIYIDQNNIRFHYSVNGGNVPDGHTASFGAIIIKNTYYWVQMHNMETWEAYFIPFKN